MKVLKEYEEESGQKTNKGKSSFFLHDNSPLVVAMRLGRLTGIKQGNFPFPYLGCPVFYGRSKICYFEDMLRKISRRIFTWHNKLLSLGRREILMGHVLQSMPIYLLTVM